MIKPAAVVPAVAIPDQLKPPVKKVAKKPVKPKVTAVKKAPTIQATKPADPPPAVLFQQPTPGQQVGLAVDQGIQGVN